MKIICLIQVNICQSKLQVKKIPFRFPLHRRTMWSCRGHISIICCPFPSGKWAPLLLIKEKAQQKSTRAAALWSQVWTHTDPKVEKVCRDVNMNLEQLLIAVVQHYLCISGSLASNKLSEIYIWNARTATTKRFLIPEFRTFYSQPTMYDEYRVRIYRREYK